MLCPRQNEFPGQTTLLLCARSALTQVRCGPHLQETCALASKKVKDQFAVPELHDDHLIGLTECGNAQQSPKWRTNLPIGQQAGASAG